MDFCREVRINSGLATTHCQTRNVKLISQPFSLSLSLSLILSLSLSLSVALSLSLSPSLLYKPSGEAIPPPFIKDEGDPSHCPLIRIHFSLKKEEKVHFILFLQRRKEKIMGTPSHFCWEDCKGSPCLLKQWNVSPSSFY